ncbi:MAG: hypothetical protein CMF26_02200 [Kiloniella sp.]|nr:hypothetical protein [Kiloniella sp.]
MDVWSGAVVVVVKTASSQSGNFAFGKFSTALWSTAGVFLIIASNIRVVGDDAGSYEAPLVQTEHSALKLFGTSSLPSDFA